MVMDTDISGWSMEMCIKFSKNIAKMTPHPKVIRARNSIHDQ